MCDLGMDQMTLVLKLDLDMVVTYLHAKIKVNRPKNGSKVLEGKAHKQTDRQTNRHADILTR